MWHEDEGAEDRYVEIFLDAATPYRAIIIDLHVTMYEEEGIELELPYSDDELKDRTSDPETIALLSDLAE